MGMTLYRSLLRHVNAPFMLHVLCFDSFTHDALTQIQLPYLNPIALDAFEKGDNDLLKAKQNRSRLEYFFTCTPSLPLYILAHFPDAETVAYLDADLYFFSDLTPIYTELGDQSILIVGHRYADNLRHLEKYGKFNVGIMVFRNDTDGLNCLRWWRARCLEWCYDRIEDGKFADQKYLDDWPTRFSRVVVLQHPGAGLAPWNVSNFTVHRKDNIVLVDDQSLVFYHFHGLKIINRVLSDPFLSKFRGALTQDLLHGVYAPYLRSLAAEKKHLSKQFPHTLDNSQRRSRRSLTRLANSNDAAIFLVGPFVLNIHVGLFLRPIISLRRFLLDTKLVGNILRKKRPSSEIPS